MLLAIGNDFDDVPPMPLRPEGPSTLLLPIPDVPVRLPPVMLLPRPLTLLPCEPSTPLPNLSCDCPGEPGWLLFAGPPLIVSCCRFDTVSSATAGRSVVRRGGGGVVLPIVGQRRGGGAAERRRRSIRPVELIPGAAASGWREASHLA